MLILVGVGIAAYYGKLPCFPRAAAKVQPPAVGAPGAALSIKTVPMQVRADLDAPPPLFNAHPH